MLDQSIQFLTPAESAAVDGALLSSPEKFLARLTLSTAKLLSYIASDLGTSVEALTSQQIIQWLEQDAKTKREQGVSAAVLKWQPNDLTDLDQARE
jgi:hypothetical protein